ncbi:MAG: cupin domain-containing protein, partial [Oscillospiraceae bacterium]
NQTYRTALWTGNYLQLTLMSLPVGEEIGLEMHSYIDQFLRVEQGNGTVSMGRCKEHLDIKHNICDDYAIFVPAGTWHNIVNTGDIPLKLYSIYSPPKHPKGTVHQTKADAIFDELKH